MSPARFMKTKIIISSEQHPVYAYVKAWGKYDELAFKKADITPGGILFLVSCSEIIDAEYRRQFDAVVVLHASALPEGRGWSPHIWQVVEGKDKITLTALLAADKVDTGDILAQREISFEGTELYDEINDKLFSAEVDLIEYIAANFKNIKPVVQVGDASYYAKRGAADSEIDANKTIAEQFNLLRVSDPERYPAFFTHKGKKFKIKIERYEDR